MSNPCLRYVLTIAFSATSACALPDGTTDRRVYEYSTESGKIARFDVSNLTLETPDGLIRFSGCSTNNYICLKFNKAVIELPRECSKDLSLLDHMSRASSRLYGLDGTSGTIFKYDPSGNKFGFGYNARLGLVAFIIIPSGVSQTVYPKKQDVAPYLYRLRTGYHGPFPCAKFR